MNYRRILCIVLCAAMLSLLGGCSSRNPESTTATAVTEGLPRWKSYQIKDLTYSLPENWLYHESGSNGEAPYYSMDNGTFSIECKEGRSAAFSQAGFGEWMNEIVAAYNVSKITDKGLFRHKDVLTYRLSFDTAYNGHILTYDMVALDGGDDIYTLILSYYTQSDYSDDFNAILNSLSLPPEVVARANEKELTVSDSGSPAESSSAPAASAPAGNDSAADPAAASADTSATVTEDLTERGTPGENNALVKAMLIMNSLVYSADGLVKQLEYEGFTHEEALYAADYCGADWNQMAKLKAEDYLNDYALTREELVEMLLEDGFTESEADYGAREALQSNDDL